MVEENQPTNEWAAEVAHYAAKRKTTGKPSLPVQFDSKGLDLNIEETDHGRRIYYTLADGIVYKVNRGLHLKIAQILMGGERPVLKWTRETKDIFLVSVVE